MTDPAAMNAWLEAMRHVTSCRDVVEVCIGTARCASRLVPSVTTVTTNHVQAVRQEGAQGGRMSISDNELDRLRCWVCGDKPSRAEVVLIKIFQDQVDMDPYRCIDCDLIAHSKQHPGLTCCEARLGHDKGCYDPKERYCVEYYNGGCPRCGNYDDPKEHL